jgi:hypothetical protein
MSYSHLCLPPPLLWAGAEGQGAERNNVVRERDRETGEQAQFDWMLDGDSCKAQPIGFHLVIL